ncbi:hypothetical protein RHMOL_Rhmol13G0209300 [Rhododendron molle]|uniref:Uncharacterized protein n=1 Tax=Rhododendron molle TaxID=49168 RepID=A0ACC0L982_RHOML|nr:hypothetical protein RHMOL_Rhmol13G0209300 [Rhododendron molle]
MLCHSQWSFHWPWWYVYRGNKPFFMFLNTANVTEQDKFADILEKMFTNLTSFATSIPSNRMYAANAGNLTKLYGMVQCTLDLSMVLCRNCLDEIIVYLVRVCSAGNKGGRLIARSCIARYELYPFLANPPVTDNVAGSSYLKRALIATCFEGNKGKMIAIGVSVSTSVVVALVGFGIYCQRRRKRTVEEEEENGERIQLLDLVRGRLVDNYSTENLQGENSTMWQDFPSVELDLILLATNHFSEENKLGEGGFGPVYKGTLPNGKDIAVKRLSSNSVQGLLRVQE